MRKSCSVRGGGQRYTSRIHDLHGGSSAGRVAAGSIRKKQEVIEGHDEIK
jgi:hypothetical protein